MTLFSFSRAIERIKSQSLRRKILCFLPLFFGLLFSAFLPSNPPRFSGTVEVDEYYLGAPVAGRIRHIYVDEGDKVDPDQRLVELERYEQAYRDFSRTQALFEEQVVSQQTLEYATLAMQDQQISSPIKGVVLQKLYEEGEVAPAGARVLVIADTGQYWVKIFVPQSMINTLQINMPAQIWLDGLKESFNGHIGYISPLAEFTPRAVQTASERTSQTFAVKIYFDHIPSTLRPGVSADVAFKNP